MSFYVASRFEDREHARVIRDKLLALNHYVTSRWMEDESQCGSDADRVIWAQNDLYDVAMADAILLYEPSHAAGVGKGGRHVEFGYAAAMDKRLYIIGQRSNIFHHLPQVSVYPTFEAFKEAVLK